MLSVITAIYNQLEVNRIFFDSLRRYTQNPFELIIIDNHSEDGSGDFFRAAGATVIANDGNYSYPRCQNQGLAVARNEVLAFLNNDVVVSPAWDQRLLQVMEKEGLEVVTGCGVERVQNRRTTRYYRKKWSLVRNTMRWCLGDGARALRWMHRLMYGDWERFTARRWERFGCQVQEGFVGSSVVMKRSALEKVGPWDERIMAADFDLYLRTRTRHLERGDIRPLHISLGVFIHHYIRMTQRGPRPPYKDQANLIRLEQKWTREKMDACRQWLEASG